MALGLGFTVLGLWIMGLDFSVSVMGLGFRVRI